MSLNELWAVAYSPSLEQYRTVKLIEILSINFQARLRKQDTDFIILAVTGTNQDAIEIADKMAYPNKVAA